MPPSILNPFKNSTFLPKMFNNADFPELFGPKIAVNSEFLHIPEISLITVLYSSPFGTL